MVRLSASWQALINEGTNVELGKHIKRYRTEHELSQEDLAAKIYVSRQTVSNWETDKTYPDVESLLLLSVLFDVTIDELIKGDVEAMKQAVSNDFTKMAVLSWGGLACALAAVVLTLGGIVLWDWNIVPSVLVGLLLWGISIALIAISGRIQKQHNLYTYRELLAYAKGEPIDRNNPRSERARRHRVLKIVIATVAGGIVGAFAGYFSYMYLF
jgi:DNA-binding XRE family transcriptional regulator